MYVAGETRAWSDDDVRAVLEAMLRAMDCSKSPDQPDRQISLRGLSWIVNPYEEGGVVIAIEITTGAAVAGPFAIYTTAPQAMIGRLLSGITKPSSPTRHFPPSHPPHPLTPPPPPTPP